MIILNQKNILEAVTMNEIMDSVEEALRIYESKDYIMPERVTIDCKDSNSLLLMPCVAKGDIATKILTLFPGNKKYSKPTINGGIMLNDPDTGEILAIMDGKIITALRTGACGGVSVRHHSRKDSESLGIIGCGVQGFYQVIAACSARNIKNVYLYDMFPEGLPAFTDRLKEALPELNVFHSETVNELIEKSDIVITTTTAKDPVIPDDPELLKNKHFVAVGSFQPEVREFTDAIFSLTDKVWVDIDFAKEESGEILIPLEEGTIKEDQIETLGNFINSGREPERGEYGTTFFKTVGMALFDLYAAKAVYEKCREKKIGFEIDF